MKVMIHLFALATLSFTMSVYAERSLSQIDDTASSAYYTEKAHGKERVRITREQRAALDTKKQQLEQVLALLEKENQTLSERFSKNERQLADQEKQLQVETGSLGELFGVVRQAAKAVEQDYQTSFMPNVSKELTLLERVISTESLPSLNTLTEFWQVIEQKIIASGEISEISVALIKGDGSQTEQTVLQIGEMALISQHGPVKWDPQNQFTTEYQELPSNATQAYQVIQGEDVLLDPTRGLLLQQYANQPTLSQRIEQGGVVGKIIIALLMSGLIIALYRGTVLLIMQAKITQQLKNPQQLWDNPMGRILQAFDAGKQQSVNAIELRLLERILDEQHGLERGLSMLKLMAALAPMLGLLGTVTGMIETFQVITQFGNSDPKVMAGGISMALVTTVMGLVAAMPLLIAHNVLSSRADTIKDTLEKQGVSLVAQRAELELLTEAK